MNECFDLISLAKTLQSDKHSSWSEVVLVRTLLELSDSFRDLESVVESQKAELLETKKALALLQNRYSEMLYHLKTKEK